MFLPAWRAPDRGQFSTFPGGIAAGTVGGSARSCLLLLVFVPYVGGSGMRSCGRTNSLTGKRVCLGGGPVLWGDTGTFGNGVALVHWALLSTLARYLLICRSSTKQGTRNRAAIKPARYPAHHRASSIVLAPWTSRTS